MSQQYVGAGGSAKLVDVGNFMEDAHELLSRPDGLPIWTPHVDAFLAHIGLPGRVLTAAYLPPQPPPPTHFAAIDDVAAVPYLNEGARQTYRQFLAKKLPRVFVIGDRRGAIAFSGGFDPLTRAMTACRRHFGSCRIYAVDNDVVWTGY